jgi:plasmid maintenance system antidote protein VapI
LNDQAPKVTRARMIIEFADGSARYFEARDPGEAEIRLLTEDDLTWERYGYRPDHVYLPADFLRTTLAPAPGTRLAGAVLRLSSWNPKYRIEIKADSGEIPPELAERALPAIDRFSAYRAHPLRMLRPYLARIAGAAMSDRELHPFKPDWTIRPGVLLGLELEERGVTPTEAAAAARLPVDVVAGVIDGTRRIEEEIAKGLGVALGISGRFWLNGQALYDEALARGAMDMSDKLVQGRSARETVSDREEQAVEGMDAAARAAGYEVTARCSMVFGELAVIEMPGEGEPVRWPASDVMAGTGLSLDEVSGARLTFTVRETAQDGRVLSDFRLA